MTHLATIRTAITGILNGVAGAGQVHSYQRYIDNVGAFKALYVKDNQLKGFWVERFSTAESSPAVGRYSIVHTWRIQGFQALDDAAASRNAFDDLIEAVRDAFRADANLGGAVSSTIVGERAGIQVEEISPVIFINAVCHQARLTLLTQHYE